jgi:hypothetical protein
MQTPDNGRAEAWIEPMSALFFDPEQRAAIRAVLPAGASAEAILSAMNALGEIAATEATTPRLGPPLSYKQQRNNLVRFKKMTRDYAQAIHKHRTPPRTPEADWYTLILRGLGHVYVEAVYAVASLDLKVKENSGRRNSHREETYARVLDVWTRLGGSLYLSHNQHHGTTTGPVIPYLRLAISLIFDEGARSDDTLIGIVKRIRAKRRRMGGVA